MATRAHPDRTPRTTEIVDSVLAWYDIHRRDLPWRAKAGESADPYRVWVSEIMLQQTTVSAVAGYFDRFIRRWPNVKTLSSAKLDEVLQAWAGLGYYARARNLHRGARMVVEQLGGEIPSGAVELIRIPGIGRYTANAIAAIAFGERVPAIDTNAERVLARLLAFEELLPSGRGRLVQLAAGVVPRDRPGDFAQALMDLGSGICLPEQPRCGECPLSRFCKARAYGLTGALPRRDSKRARIRACAVAFVAIDKSGAVYLERRADRGLFGGMMQPPLSELRKNFPNDVEAISGAPFAGTWKRRAGTVRHVLTHRELEIRTYVARFARRPQGEGVWIAPADFAVSALPTAMRKILNHALTGRGDSS